MKSPRGEICRFPMRVSLDKRPPPFGSEPPTCCSAEQRSCQRHERPLRVLRINCAQKSGSNLASAWCRRRESSVRVATVSEVKRSATLFRFPVWYHTRQRRHREKQKKECCFCTPLFVATTSQVAAWCWRRESNPRPIDYESIALPTEPRQHIKFLESNVGRPKALPHCEHSSCGLWLQTPHCGVCFTRRPD